MLSPFILPANEIADRQPTEVLAAATNRIVLGDCLSTLRQLPDDCVDLIHTSPPYNIDKGYRASFRDRGPIRSYGDFLSAVIVEMRRVLRPNGSLFWQTGYTDAPGGIPGDILPIDHLSYRFFREEPGALILWDRIIWRYFGGMAFKRKFTNRHETILWFAKPQGGTAEPIFNLDEVRERSRELDKRNNFWGKNPGNVWEVDRVAFGSTEATSHIAVYPEAIAEKIVRAASNPGDLILDPFSGSGTTPKVARSLDRRWIGIELSGTYAAESATRLGFQQPNELQSLASHLIKERVFGGQRARRSRDDLVAGLHEWAAGVDLEAARRQYETLVGEVFPQGEGGPEVKTAKPDAWERFDRILRERRDDPIADVDDLLSRDYRNRRNLNSAHRYRSALELASALSSRIASADVEAFIGQLLVSEPSSYQIDGPFVHLLETQKVAKVVGDGWEEWMDALRQHDHVAGVSPEVVAEWSRFATARVSEVGEERFKDLLDESAMFGETRVVAAELKSDLFWVVRDEVTSEFGSAKRLGSRQVFRLVARALDELAAASDAPSYANEHSAALPEGYDGGDL